MKKVELLSPVGNMETLYYAIHNGADAVYFAGKKFGARKFAQNFDDEEIVKAIKYCHLYGVKVYMTVNTLIFDDELEEVLNYIGFLHQNGVDALIMQDIGLIAKTHERYPNLDIHISTQSHNHNAKGIEFFQNLGATRIVLDREMSLDEIKALDISLEKEVFVHGALCVSYSGCCLFSSMNGGRSGNRGECVASCRLKYDLYKNDQKVPTDGEYLLSTKELNTLNRIGELIDAGIDSFKIEGRMKSAEYVGFVTRLYRQAIDNYYSKKDIEVSEEDLYSLKTLYNREFTEGYLFNNQGRGIMNITSPNHLGTHLGDVIEFDNKYIKIKLTHDVKQEDGIRLPNGEGMILNRIYDDKMLLVNSLKKGQILIIDNKVNLKKKGQVRKTVSKELLDSLKRVQEKKIPVSITIVCKPNQELKMTISDYQNTITKTYSKAEIAKSSPTSKERITSQITKLGNTPFTVQEIKEDIADNIFVSIKDLNELRRQAVDDLITLRENKKRQVVINEDKDDSIKKKNQTPRINVLVRNEVQLKASLKNNVDNIYTDVYELYIKYKDRANIYLRLPRVNLKHKDYSCERLLVTEIGSLEKYYQDNDVIGDYTLNITNHETVKTLSDKAKLLTVSPEITPPRLTNTNFINDAVEYIIYGRVELMIMKYCPIKMLDNHDFDNCNLCSLGNKYYLMNREKEIFPIINTKHYTHIMHKEPLDNISYIKDCLKLGINNFRVELFDEDEQEIDYIIKKIRRELGD